MTTQQNHHATDWNTVVADNIRAEMARQRWSGRKLAARLGVQPTWVNRRASGATPLDPNDIALFADVLGVSIQSLFGNEKMPPTPKGGGLKLPELDSNQQPAGNQPGNVTPIRPRQTETDDYDELAPVTALFA